MNMKPRTKHFFAMALVMVMVCCIAAGCQTDEPNENADVSVALTETEGTEETVWPAPEIVDYDGYNYRIYAYEDGYGHLGNFVVEENSGDTVDSAIYNRNLKIEEQYNIKITATVKTDVMDQMRKCAVAGDDFADLTSYCIRWQFSNNLIDCAANLRAIDTLRLDGPWWDQGFNDEFTINGVLQSSVGDIIGTDEVCTTAYLYNKAIFSAVGHTPEEVYQAVDNGTWTIDRLIQWCSEATSDINGDSKMDKNDRWGSSYDSGTMWILFVGAGYNTMEKSAGGGYQITLESERAYNIFSRALGLFSKENSIHLETGVEAVAAFKNSHTLFIPFLLGNTNQMRDMKDDYGIIPVPKYDESQEKYYSEASIWTNTVYIPVTVSDPERTGLITEALAYESQFNFQKAIYDVMLMEKYARDTQSQKMLDLIFSSKKWSLDIAADISGLRGMIGELSTTQKDTFSSSIAKIMTNVTVKLQKFLDNYAELESK